jgi:glutathione S-transferase
MITLEECGASYSIELVRFMKGAHKSPDYLAMNPKGKVPCLVTPDGALTENVAIAAYLSQHHTGLMPPAETPYEQALQLADLTFCSATLHPIVTRIRMPMFMADGAEAVASVRAKAIDAMQPFARLVEDRLENGPWWYGQTWSIMDAYIYWVWFRITGAGFDPKGYTTWADHAARMEQRPAVQRALAKDAALQTTLEAEGLAPKFG